MRVCVRVCVGSQHGAFGFSDWHIQRVFWGSPCSSHSKAKKLESSLARALPTYSLKEHLSAHIKQTRRRRRRKKKNPTTCVAQPAWLNHQHTCARPSKHAREYLPHRSLAFSSSPPTLKWIRVSWQEKPQHLSILLSDRAKRTRARTQTLQREHMGAPPGPTEAFTGSEEPYEEPVEVKVWRM